MNSLWDVFTLVILSLCMVLMGRLLQKELLATCRYSIKHLVLDPYQIYFDSDLREQCQNSLGVYIEDEDEGIYVPVVLIRNDMECTLWDLLDRKASRCKSDSIYGDLLTVRKKYPYVKFYKMDGICDLYVINRKFWKYILPPEFHRRWSRWM